LPLLRVERRHEPAHAELAARRAHEHLALRHERRQGDVVRRLVVGDGGGPHLFPGLRVERHQHRLGGGVVDPVAEERDASVGVVQHEHVLGARRT
jgi:hypothetical protein